MAVTKYNPASKEDRTYLIEVAKDVLSWSEDDIQENVVAQALIDACSLIDDYESAFKLLKYIRLIGDNDASH